jgi:3-hydroxyisobutyrate dehydrogenase-like beta-hydroxyacid dehydrogenase
VVRAVAELRFSGIYVDANAVSPGTAREIAALAEWGGATFVDGGIIGLPPAKRGSTRLYLSGKEAARVASLFEGTALETIALDGPVGAASALKLAYASWTKGTSALLLAIRAFAAAEDVEDALLSEWQRSMPDLLVRCERAVKDNVRKAWRFVGEMEEIGASFADARLPAGFFLAAREIYQRLEGYKNTETPPSMEEVIEAITQNAAKSTGGGVRQ